MTTVVALDKGTSVVFASDSQVTIGGNKFYIEEKFIVYPNLVIGCAGLARGLQELRHTFKPPTFSKTDRNNPQKYLATKLVPALTKALSDIEFVDPEIAPINTFLVAVPGLLARIDSSAFFCTPVGEFGAIGSGSEYALGALGAGADVETAVNIAKEYDNNSGGDTHVKEVKWTD